MITPTSNQTTAVSGSVDDVIMAEYTRICSGCDHPVTTHRLEADVKNVSGPYQCRYGKCRCTITQGDQSWPIAKDEFLRRYLLSGILT